MPDPLFVRPGNHGTAGDQISALLARMAKPAPADAAAPAPVADAVAPAAPAADMPVPGAAAPTEFVADATPAADAPRAGIRSMGIQEIGDLFRRGGAAPADAAPAGLSLEQRAAQAIASARQQMIDSAAQAGAVADDAVDAAKVGLGDQLVDALKALRAVNPKG